MKIEIASLRLVGCGPFDDVTLNFCDNDGKPKKTILLAGANGSGKTTVLEAITEIFSRTISFNRIADGRFRTGYGEMTAIYDSIPGILLGGHRPVDTIDTEPLSEQVTASIQKIRELLKDTPKNLCPSRILYFPHPRFLLPVSADFLHPEEFTYTLTFKQENSNQFPGSLSSYLVWLEYSDNDEYNKIVEYLESLQINNKKFKINRKKLQTEVVTSEDTVHSIDKLSSGEQNLFMILLELRRQLTKGSIVLIDEVEGSLHPAYQYKLVYALQKLQKEFELQLIMTTHSLDILKAVGPGNTLFLTDFSHKVPEPKL